MSQVGPIRKQRKPLETAYSHQVVHQRSARNRLRWRCPAQSQDLHPVPA